MAGGYGASELLLEPPVSAAEEAVDEEKGLERDRTVSCFT